MANPGAITYRFEHEKGPLDARSSEQLLAKACAAWSAAGPVAFQPVPEGRPATLVVSWQRATHGACRPFGIDTAVAHTTTIEGQVQIHLDLDRQWKRDGLREGLVTPLYQTLLHELGHVLGLGHTPDEGALLATDPKTERIERSDRDGLGTLYSEANPGPNDLVVSRAGKRTATLRGLRVEGASEAQFFDADGDGRDEVLVWRIDPAGFGQMVVFFFDDTGSVVRTVGPRFGIVDGAALVSLVVSEAGERLVVLEYPNATRVAQSFGDDAVPTAFLGELPPISEPGRRRLEGDLDGDGQRESRIH